MEKFKFETPDLTKQNIEKIERIFPNCITEDIDENGNPKKAINFDILRQMLSDEIVEGDEAYEFSWVGKKNAMLEANKPIRKTLRPCKEESVNWENTENLYIEGDNLEVLKLLQESYLGTVKMIYIDPPYNTGKDSFTYSDDFSIDNDEYLEISGQVDENGTRLFKENLKSNPRFHSDWCSMMYSRLLLARNLLSDDGVIFISIDDNEQENLKKICDEIFGGNNFIGQWNWFKSATPPNLSKKIKKNIEYILCYEKKLSDFKYKGLKKTSPSSNGLLNQTNKFAILHFPANVVESGLADGLYKAGNYGTNNYQIVLLDDVFVKSGFFINDFRLQAKFKWGQDNLISEIRKGTKIAIRTKSFSPSYEKQEYDPEVPPNFINKDVGVDTTEQAGKSLSSLFDDLKIFDYPKPVELIEYLINFICFRKDSIILDFFSGSATTAHAVMKLNAEDGGNRKFIMVQLQEPCKEDSEAYKEGYKNICEIGKERIRRAAKKIKEENPNAKFDGGFRVFKVADSNMNDVFYSAGEYSKDLLSMAEDNIKSDRTDMDLLYGCLLDWGVPISMRHKEETVNGFKIHIYGNGEIIDLIACFEENISEALIKEIARKQPLKAVFRDSCFANSPSKINAEEIFKLISPDTRIKVI